MPAFSGIIKFKNSFTGKKDMDDFLEFDDILKENKKKAKPKPHITSSLKKSPPAKNSNWQPSAYKPQTKNTDLILDLVTPLEKVARFTLLAGGIVFLLSLIMQYNIPDIDDTLYQTTLSNTTKAVMIFGILIAAIGAILMFNTDCYYIIRPRTKQLLFRRLFFKKESIKPVASFNQIAKIEIQGRSRLVRRNRFFSLERRSVKINEFWIAAILKNGTTINLSDIVKGNEHIPIEYKKKAEQAAELIGCQFDYNGKFTHYTIYPFF